MYHANAQKTVLVHFLVRVLVRFLVWTPPIFGPRFGYSFGPGFGPATLDFWARFCARYIVKFQTFIAKCGLDTLDFGLGFGLVIGQDIPDLWAQV